MGGGGLFLAALLDSSFIPLPEAVDLWLMTLSVLQPSRMPYYVLLSTVGSLLGSGVLYFIFRRGEEVLEKNPKYARLAHVQRWVEKYEVLALLVGAILPPPAPFKLVVIAAALMKCRVDRFAMALVLGRTIRYTAEGLLAVRYGRRAWRLLLRFGPRILLVAVIAIAVVLVIRRLIGKNSAQES